MTFEHDPEHLSADPGERRAERLGAALSAGAAEETYHNLLNNPEVLKEIAEYGWVVTMPKDEQGQVKSVEIKDAKGNVQFYENIEAMKKLAAEKSN